MNAPQAHGTIVEPPRARRIVAALRAAGFECFAVGGCVRDALRGVAPMDWDFTTDATVDAMKRAFDAHDILWKATGERHGTLTALVDGDAFEVTTYRVDGAYSDGRHPDAVTFTRSLTEDLARRDFTINAMAWSADTGIVDPFDGASDLAAGVIRAVGDAKARFAEDGLRILRALRFAATLGFSIEDATAAALYANVDRLDALSRERVFAEIDRLLSADGAPLRAIVSAHATILSRALLGSPTATLKPESIAALAFAPSDPIVRWALLLDAIGKSADAAETLRGLHAPKSLARDVETLLTLRAAPPAADRRALRRLLVQCGSFEMFERTCALDRSEDLARADRRASRTRRFDQLIGKAREELDGGLPMTLHDLAIGGADLIDRGWTPGPAVGRTLRTLFEAVVDLRLPNDRPALLAALEDLRQRQRQNPTPSSDPASCASTNADSRRTTTEAAYHSVS